MQRLPQYLPQSLIVFDGECVLCSGFYRFMIKHDRRQRFTFTTAQSPIGQLYQRLDAFAAAMRALGGICHLPALLRFLPNGLKDFTHHRIARNRYRIFGRYEACMLPTPAQRARFVEGGF